MKTWVLKRVIATFFFAGMFLSCKKDNNNNNNLNLLTRAAWKFSKDEERINSDPFVDDFPSQPACNQDDQYVFSKNNTYEINEGLTTCNAGDPQIITTGQWSFTQTGINIDGSVSAIEQLDQNTFIVSGSYISNPDTNYYRYTFVH